MRKNFLLLLFLPTIVFEANANEMAGKMTTQRYRQRRKEPMNDPLKCGAIVNHRRQEGNRIFN